MRREALAGVKHLLQPSTVLRDNPFLVRNDIRQTHDHRGELSVLPVSPCLLALPHLPCLLRLASLTS